MRQYFNALGTGRIVDALDVFATDATVRDADGTVHRGIRAIAASLAHARQPRFVDLIELTREGDRVAAVVEFRGTKDDPALRYRDVFTISRQRVKSLTVAPDRPRARSKMAPAPARPAQAGS